MEAGKRMTEARPFDTVLFDLDGTLLDTLKDLTDSVNTVLGQYGMPQYTEAEVRSFVGNGIRRLIQLVVPGGEAHPKFEEIHQVFREYYKEHCMDATEPYPGIMNLLGWLKKEGYQTAVVSNKADAAVKILSRVYFSDLISVAIGESEGCRRKPAPDSVLQAMKELNAVPERTVYVGDSDVDLRTAENAGIPCIAVSWGFRDREFLKHHGASEAQIASDVNGVKRLICEWKEKE